MKKLIGLALAFCMVVGLLGSFTGCTETKKSTPPPTDTKKEDGKKEAGK